MAKYTKKRARQLKHDRFREATMSVFDRLGTRLEGKGRVILYAGGGLLAIVILAGIWSWWSRRHADQAEFALGEAIQTATAPVTTSPSPGTSGPTFSNETDRAQRAVEEFQQIASRYGEPYRDIARYFSATNSLILDRSRGEKELESLSASANHEVSSQAKFALAQAYEADGQNDRAQALYSDLLKTASDNVPSDTLKVRLASVDEKMGKKTEAADILFNLVETARKSQDKEGKPVPQSAGVREAAQELQKLDPDRYAKLPPESSSASGLSM